MSKPHDQRVAELIDLGMEPSEAELAASLEGGDEGDVLAVSDDEAKQRLADDADAE
jgi:hypothetical protein